MLSRNQSITNDKSTSDSSSHNISTSNVKNKSKSSLTKSGSQHSEVKVSSLNNEETIDQSKIGIKEPSLSGHLEINTSMPGQKHSVASSAVSSIDLDVTRMKNINDSINLYRDDFGITTQTETLNVHPPKTHSSVISNASNTHSKSGRHTIKVKNYEKNLIKNLVHSMKSFNVFNISPIVSPIDTIEQINQALIEILKQYSLGTQDELKCGVCCIDNLNFKESFFCKQQLENQIKLKKSLSSLNLNELANKINTFNPFENCTILDSEIRSQYGSKNYKSDESLYTASECSKLNGSNLSLKLKYKYFDSEENAKKRTFKQLKSMSEISNNLDLTLNSSSTISFMNNSQDTHNYSGNFNCFKLIKNKIFATLKLNYFYFR